MRGVIWQCCMQTNEIDRKKLKPCSEGGITYTYDVTPDMVVLNVRGPGTSAISVGPIKGS